MKSAVIESMGKHDVLFVSPTMSTSLLSNLDDDFIRAVPAHDQQAAIMHEFLVDTGVKRVGIVYDASNIPYTGPVYESLKGLIKDDMKSVVYEKDMKKTQRTLVLL